MRAINASIMRRLNRTLILKNIRLRPISRAELAEETGLTRASVTQIVEELISEGIVMETSIVGRSRLGRRSTQLAIAPNAGVIFGVTLSRKQCNVGAVNMRGAVLRQNTELVPNRSPEEIMDCITRMIERQAHDLGLDKSRIFGVGISAPGPVDAARGCILNPSRFDSWHNQPMAQQLETRTGLPVALRSTAEAQALEAMYFGKMGENFALLRVDDTVSTALVSRSRLYGGAPDVSVEIGQCPIAADGGRTLDQVISIPALLEDTPYRSWPELVSHRGEAAADGAIDKLAWYLSLTIANITYAYSVNRIVLAGTLDQGLPELLPCLRDAVERRMNASLIPVIQRCDSELIRMSASVFYNTLFSLE